MRTTEEWLVRAYLLRVADAAVASDFGERGTGVRVPEVRCLPRAADAAGVVDRREGCRHEGH